jgi:hypothetical protein
MLVYRHVALLRAKTQQVAGRIGGTADNPARNDDPEMTPNLRKVLLTAHIAFSVGWLGAVAGFLALSIAGKTSQDAEMVRGAYLAMDVIGRFVIVPFSLLALASGLIQALGTEWGLIRYYWVLVKFLLTLFATSALLLHQFTAVAEAARLVSGIAPVHSHEVGKLGTQLVADAGLALMVLLVITILSVFKPWGRTRFGRIRQQERLQKTGLTAHSPDPDTVTPAESLPAGIKVLIAIIVMLVVVFIVVHLAGGGFGPHGH